MGQPLKIRTYQPIEDYLRKVYPAQPTAAQIGIGIKWDNKRVSNQLFYMKNLGLVAGHGRGTKATWRLNAMTYSDTGVIAFERDENLSAYATLAAMQAVARNRLTNREFYT